MPSHYIGAAGELLAASVFLADGHAVYWPAVAGWVDFVVQTHHGFKRVQVKTCDTSGPAIRVRRLGSTKEVQPSDRYDILAVVHRSLVWLIPASVLDGKDTITLNTNPEQCPYAGYRKR